MMTTWLRAVAIGIATAAAVDPAISVSRSQPVAVELVSGSTRQATDARRSLLSMIERDAIVARPGEGDAVIAIDGRIDARSIRENVTISAVIMADSPNLRIVGAAARPRCLPGHESTIDVDVEALKLTGRTSVITVAQKGIEVGRIERTWTGARRQRVEVPFVPVASGTQAVRVTASLFEDESRRDDNAIDTSVVTVQQPLRIAFIEPRPSWSAGFVRRALESDPAFEVISIVRPSRGIEVRTGAAPASLTPAALQRFDLVLAGAPEELRGAELDAMRAFMTERAGTVVFLPDRRPSGAYVGFVTPAGFDEVLLDAAVKLDAVRGGPALRASEFAVPRTPAPAMRSIAALPDGRPAIAAWPVGDGQLIFAGALDAWRFRADDDDRFAAFWRASVAAAALAAPPPVSVEVDPRVIKPGGETRVIARIRRTEFEHGADGSIGMPVVRAVAVGGSRGDGAPESVRLWPTTEPGVFEGRLSRAAEGAYSIHVTAGRAQNVTVVPEAAIPEPVGPDDEEARIVASATGGAVATAADLTQIVEHLRSLARIKAPATIHPMRSGWWTLPFALALCAEWALRRRRGAL